jgi:acyl-CoA thioesterase-2
VLKVRRARPADVEGIAQVHASSGRDAYRDFLPHDVLDSPDRLASRRKLWSEVLDRLRDQTEGGKVEGLWVAIDTDAPDEVLGFIHTDRCTDVDAAEDSAVITTFYVTTDRQGEHLGQRLMHRAEDHLLATGHDDLRLWTLQGNERAQQWYAKRGWQLDGATRPVPADDYEAIEVRLRIDRATIEARPLWRSGFPMIDTMLAQPIDDDRYLADAPGWFGPRVFGGAVVAQVVTAAALAAQDAGGAGATGRAHSLHTHFLRALQPGPVELRTEAIRTGRTFTTIRVDSVQGGRVAATSIVSFHADEDDVPYQLPMAEVPRPDSLPVSDDAPPPFETCWIGPTEPRADGTYESTRRCWIRLAAPLPDDPLAALLVSTVLSDLTGTSFRPYSLDEWGTHTDASIDHAVWFHRPPRTDGWLFCDFHALANLGGRSTVRGTFHDERGDLVLSMAQELLIRPL